MTLPDENVRLETLITASPEDVEGRIAVMQQVLRTTLVVPSGTAAQAWQDLSPVMVTTGPFQSVAVFTSADAMQQMVGDQARFALTIAGDAIISQLAPHLGLAVAAPKGMVVFDPELLGAVRDDLVGRARSEG